jgi:hypothetical protein
MCSVRIKPTGSERRNWRKTFAAKIFFALQLPLRNSVFAIAGIAGIGFRN